MERLPSRPRAGLKRVFDQNPRQARFFAVPVHEALADLLRTVAVRALEGFFRETRLPRVLPGLHPRVRPALLRILRTGIELDFLDARRRRHARADGDAQRALLGAVLPVAGNTFGLARAHDDARRGPFLAHTRR